MSPNPGEQLGGRYTLVSRIAAGGMGEVWKATDTVLKREVAVKILRPSVDQEPAFAERFRDEARHTAMLSHPSIATTYDYGEDGHTAYLVMELVPGKALSQIISERAPLSADETSRILSQAAEALAAAHAAGVVHRDVKPGNIIVTPTGAVKLTDFGIARALGDAALTRTGEVIGTPHYLSPEQALGRPATAASDVYALGVVGYEMLAGRRPFDAETPVATALAHVNDVPPPLPMWVPPSLASAIMAALAKEPVERPASARAFAISLGGLVAEPAPTQIVSMPVSPTMQLPVQPIPMPPTAVTDSAPSEPAKKKTNPAVWLVPLLMVLGVGTYFAFQSAGGTPEPGVTTTITRTITPTTTTTSSSSPVTTTTESRTSTAPPKISVVESDYLGRPGDEVAEAIKGLGLAVAPIAEQPSDQPAGLTLSVSPNGEVDRDSTITITVSSGFAPTEGG